MERDSEVREPSATSQEIPREAGVEVRVLAAHEREIELYRKEKELAEREVQLMRKEIELLKEAQRLSATNQEQVPREGDISRDVARASISAIADLLSYFDGSVDDYENWELQLKLLKKTYHLTDDYVKILIGMRLRGGASAWFRSKA